MGAYTSVHCFYEIPGYNGDGWFQNHYCRNIDWVLEISKKGVLSRPEKQNIIKTNFPSGEYDNEWFYIGDCNVEKYYRCWFENNMITRLEEISFNQYDFGF